MIYGGRGEWSDFDGHAMDGRIVLLEFDSWNHWLRAASLGARAVVFIEPEQANRHQAAAKYAHVPARHSPLLDRARNGYSACVNACGMVSCWYTCRAAWSGNRRPAWNIWGVIPGADPELADERVAIEAYYDGISVVPGRAPSAEAACGIAALLELARHLAVHPPARTIILSGDLGSLSRSPRHGQPFSLATPVPWRNRST